MTLKSYGEGTRVFVDEEKRMAEFHRRFSILIETCGAAYATPERVTEIAADVFLGNMPGQSWYVGTCPGYGASHMWAVVSKVDRQNKVIELERCEEHPERRRRELQMPDFMKASPTTIYDRNFFEPADFEGTKSKVLEEREQAADTIFDISGTHEDDVKKGVERLTRNQPETHAESHHLDVSLEVARSLHRVIRAMHDGECPSCHRVFCSEAMLVTGGARWVCPGCHFAITQEESDAAIAEFAPAMKKNLEVFLKWRANRRSASR